MICRRFHYKRIGSVPYTPFELLTLNRLDYFTNKNGWGERGGVFFMIGFIMLSSELLTLNRLGYFDNKDGWG